MATLGWPSVLLYHLPVMIFWTVACLVDFTFCHSRRLVSKTEVKSESLPSQPYPDRHKETSSLGSGLSASRWEWLYSGPLHMSPVDRAGAVTEMKIGGFSYGISFMWECHHMVIFSPLSEMKILKKWWRDHSGVKSNKQAWREFLDFLCLNNLKFLLTLR